MARAGALLEVRRTLKCAGLSAFSHRRSDCAIIRGPTVRSSEVPMCEHQRSQCAIIEGPFQCMVLTICIVRGTVSGRQTGVTVDHLPGRLSSGPPDSASSLAAVAGLPETGPRGLPCELASHASVAGHPETGPQRLQRDTLSTRAAVAGLPRSGPQRLQRRFHTQPLRDSRRSARSGCNVSRTWGGGEDTRPPARSNFLSSKGERWKAPS